MKTFLVPRFTRPLAAGDSDTDASLNTLSQAIKEDFS